MKPRHRLVSATRRLWPTVMTIMNVILLIVVSSTSLLARVGKPDGPGIIGKARRGWEWGSAWGYWAWADLRPIRLSRFLLPLGQPIIGIDRHCPRQQIKRPSRGVRICGECQRQGSHREIVGIEVFRSLASRALDLGTPDVREDSSRDPLRHVIL
jgi:hypothetical protein